MKRITSVLLTSALIVGVLTSLVACGSDSTSEAKETTSSKEVQEEIIEKDTTETSEVILIENNEEIIEEEEEEIPEFIDKQLKSQTKCKINGDAISKIEYTENGDVSLEEEYEGSYVTSYGGTYKIEYQYNSFGLTSKTKSYWKKWFDGDEGYIEHYKEQYDYDDNGNLIREITWKTEGLDSDYHIDSVIEHDYNENNNCIASYILTEHAIGYSKSASDFTRDDNPYETFTYDNSEKLISANTENGKALTNYTYDNNGNLTTEKIYTGSNLSLNEAKEYSYNKNNLLESVIVYDGVGEVKQTTTYEYDKNGNILSEETTEPNGSVVDYVTYWDNGNIKTENGKNDEDGKFYRTYWSNGNLKTENGNEYDYCGNIIYDSGTKIKYEYTYDEYGNKIAESDVGYGETTEYTYINEYYD